MHASDLDCKPVEMKCDQESLPTVHTVAASPYVDSREQGVGDFADELVTSQDIGSVSIAIVRGEICVREPLPETGDSL